MSVEPYLEYRPITGSTNDDLKEWIRQGCAHGTAIYAGSQTEGRGRSGRSWHAPDVDNLYFSVALTRDTNKVDMRTLPFLAAVCVAQWLANSTDVAFGLKWPNDVLVGNHKLAGILCEGVTPERGRLAAVMGIGINVNARKSDFPDELDGIATSLREETGETYDVETIARDLRARIVQWYDTLMKAGPKPVLDQWRKYEQTSGRTVLIVDDELEGVAEGITEDGALRVRIGDGTLRKVYAGDVRFTET
jgi:BirA family biotin operon repressor/biotin-[acetyl-CoA-carboxylase] ligase